MNKCMSCGRPSSITLCKKCEETWEVVNKRFKKGVEIEYQDGTKEMLKVPTKEMDNG